MTPDIKFSPRSQNYTYTPVIGDINNWLTEELDSSEQTSASYFVNHGNLSPLLSASFLIKDFKTIINKSDFLLIGHIRIENNQKDDISSLIMLGLDSALKILPDQFFISSHFEIPIYNGKITPNEIIIPSDNDFDKWNKAVFVEKNSLQELIEELKPTKFDSDTNNCEDKNKNPIYGKVCMLNSCIFQKNDLMRFATLSDDKFIGFSPIVLLNQHDEDKKFHLRCTGLAYGMAPNNQVVFPNNDQKFIGSNNVWPRTYPQWNGVAKINNA